MQGLANLTLTKKTHFSGFGDLALMIRKNKFSINIMGGGAHINNIQSTFSENQYRSNSSLTRIQDNVDGYDRNGWGTLQVDYHLSEQNILGASIAFGQKRKFYRTDGSTIFLSESSSVSSYPAISHNKLLDGKSKEVQGNFNFRHQFHTQGMYLNIDADYIRSNIHQYDDAQMDRYEGNYSSPATYNHYQQQTTTHTDVWSGKFEYGIKKETYTFQTGADTYYSSTRYNSDYKTTEGQTAVVSFPFDRFNMNEWTSALFVHVEKTWEKKFSSSIGTRLEYTSYITHQQKMAGHNKRNYWKFLPELYLNYTFSPKHNLSYSLTSRVKRPYFAWLNPYKIYDSATTYTTGNPELNAMTYFNQTLQYHFLQHFTLWTTYNISLDNIGFYKFTKEDTQIENKPVNAGRCDIFQLAFNTNSSYWNGKAYINFNIIYEWKRMKTSVIEGEKFSYKNHNIQFFLNNNLSLSKKKDWIFNLYMNGRSAQINNNQKSFPTLSIEGEICKKLRNWHFSLYGLVQYSIHDNRMSNKWKKYYESNTLLSESLIDVENTVVGFKISYNFGNSKTKGAEKRNTSNENVRSRIGIL